MKKNFILLIILQLLLISMNVSTLAVEPDYVLSAATRTAIDYPWTVALFEFDRLLNENTNGRVRLEIFHSGALGSERAITEQVMDGTLDMAVPALNRLSYWDEDWVVWDLPYVIDNHDDGVRLVNGKIFEEMSDSFLKNYGIRVLNPLASGLRCIANNKKPVKKLEDVKGLKLRVAPTDLSIKTFSLLGADAIAMDMTEVFSAVQQGVVDGYENDPASHFTHKYYEVTKYLSITNTVFLNGVIIINEKSFKKLPTDIQYLILGISDQVQKYVNDMFKEDTEKSIINLQEKGVIIDYPDLEEFKNAVKPVYEEFREKLSPGLVDAVLNTAVY